MDAVCFHELFARQAERTPDALALWYRERRLTYRELNQQANRLARRLHRQGVGPESVVALYVERGEDAIETFVALLAVLKAGGAYLILDAAHPSAWTEFALRDARAVAVLTLGRLMARAAAILDGGAHLPIIALDALERELQAEPSEAFESGATASSLAYVIYTSGTSSGHPKGVLVEHAWLGALAQATIEEYGLTSEDRVAQHLWLGFDASVLEYSMAWLAGAALCVAPAGALVPGPVFARFLREHRVSATVMTPSIARALPDEAFATVRVAIVGGEVASAAPAMRISACGTRYVPAYGLTETVVMNLASLYPADGSAPTLGRPLGHVAIEIWGEDRRPVERGRSGQIVLGGPLARGYTDARLTAERFVLSGGRRWYLTGDRGRENSDGTFSFGGRIDDGEIKVEGGFRVSLRAIEATVLGHPSACVTACAVVARRDESAATTLVAYVVLAERGKLSPQSLHAHLRCALPSYMLPCAYVELDHLPSARTGKASSEPDDYPLPSAAHWIAADEVSAAPLVPRTTTELAVASIVLRLKGAAAASAQPQTLDFGKTLKQLRVDSRKVAAFLMQLAKQFGVRLDVDELGLPLTRIVALVEEQRTR